MSGSCGAVQLSASGAFSRWVALWLLTAAIAAFGASRAVAQDAAEDFAAEAAAESDPEPEAPDTESTGGPRIEQPSDNRVFPTEAEAVAAADRAKAATDAADTDDVADPEDASDASAADSAGSDDESADEASDISAGDTKVEPAPRGQALEEPVEAGRKALGRWFSYPWYDRKADDLQPIKLPAPPSTSSWANWDLEWIKWFAWAALAVALTLLAFYILRAYVERERRAAKTNSKTGLVAVERAGLESLPFEVRRPRAGLLDEARRHYEAGNYAEAIIYLFSHRLVELDRHQVIRLTKGKTNRQYLREVGASSPVARILDQTMGHFEAVFFGKHPLRRVDFEACWNEQAAFDQLLAEPAVVAALAG